MNFDREKIRAEIIDQLGDRAQWAGLDPSTFADHVVDLMEAGKANPVLDYVNTVLALHGVESVQDGEDEVVAEYVNTGDVYSGTMFAYYEQDCWVVTDYAKFMKQRSSE